MSDSDKKPITPEELLAGFRDQVEMDRIEQETAAMSHEELVADLRKDGIDPAATLAKDRAMIEKSEAQRSDSRRAEKPPPSKVRDIRSARRWPSIVVTAGASLAFAAAAVVMLGRTGVLPSAFLTPAPSGTATSAVPRITEAEAMRREAFSLCLSEDYVACVADLDEAKQLDPEGETHKDVIAARTLAELGLAKRREH